MRPATALTLLVISLGSAAVTRPEEPEPWAGRKVVPRSLAPLRVGGTLIDGARDHRVYTVEEVEGDRLRVVGGGARGWVGAGEVVPVEEATRYFHGLIRAHPRDPAGYLLRGQVWRDKGQFDAALADFTEAIRLAPKDAAGFANRGAAWAGKKAFDRAIRDYDQALRLNPREAVALRNRGDAWADLGALDRAIRDYDEALRLNPDDALAYNERGWVWYQRQRYDRAIRDYDEALRRDPALAWAYSNRGLARSFRGEYDGALRDFDEALRIDPYLAAAYNNRAWLWASCPEAKYRDGSKAIESATRACELSGWKRAAFLDTLAAAHAEAGDLDAARRWQTKALESVPKGDKDYEAIRTHFEDYQRKAPAQKGPPAGR